jgi:polyhydroxybutyrate depolymerase
MSIAVLVVASFSLAAAADDLKDQSWTVDGVTREGLVRIPEAAKQNPAPLVFVFHGHGGGAKQVSRSCPMHLQWPEAVVIYPQGLPTPSQLVDPEGKKSGWQHRPKDQDDRDLKLFDEMLKQIKAACKIDDTRIYCTGHSNGGAMTYLLWGQRGDVFAAMAPSAAMALPALHGKYAPKPAMHLGGEKDTLVPWSRQKSGIDTLIKLNDCEKDAKPWGKQPHCTVHESKAGTPVVVHCPPDGTHAFPKNGAELITAFFKEHKKAKP